MPTTTITTATLRKAAPAGNLRADRLVEQNAALAHWVVGRWLRRLGIADPNVRDDATGVAMLSMVRLARGWDPFHGARFSTYAVRGMFRELRKWWDGERRFGFGGGHGTPGRPAVLAAEHTLWGREPTPDELAEEREDGRRTSAAVAGLLAAVNALPPRLRAAVRGRHLEGLSLAEVGEQMPAMQPGRPGPRRASGAAGVCRERARQLVRAGMARLRAALNPPAPATPPPAPKPRTCAHCRAAIPNVGSRKYCRPGTGCRADWPARPLVTGKSVKVKAEEPDRMPES